MNKGNYGFPKNRTYEAPSVVVPYIPQPEVYAQRNTAYLDPIKSHSHGVALPTTEALSPSWSDNRLLLQYKSTNLDFLAYNPKYFLFVYKSHRRAQNYQTTNLRSNAQYYHPANLTHDADGFYPAPTYKNFSDQAPNGNWRNDFNSFITEWDVADNIGKATHLTGFNPLRFYYNTQTSYHGDEFFPMNPDTEYNKGIVTTSKRYTHWTNYMQANHPKPRVNLHIKFAIVIQNPADTARYIIGPYSDGVTISPLSGFFEDGTGINKYYYGWRTRIH